jgi:O-antigen ligase
VPVLAACALMILSRRERRPPRWLMALVPLLLIASVAAVLSAPIGNNSIGEEARGSVATRSTSFSISLDAAGDFMPVGSGIGSFQQIYRTREDPVAVTREYMNHVHNDYIELALETGAPGLLVLILFLVWWTTRAVSVWRAQVRDPYALAATVASAAILAHSLVEYPLRTAALSAFFAMCLALMAEPRPASRARPKPREAEPPGARHLSAD